MAKQHKSFISWLKLSIHLPECSFKLWKQQQSEKNLEAINDTERIKKKWKL
jgi:hypothetical protein